jgi:hypothetical protein
MSPAALREASYIASWREAQQRPAACIETIPEIHVLETGKCPGQLLEIAILM